MSRTRHWVFTLNNYNNDDERRIQDLANQSRVSYVVYGRETGNAGTPHLQGFISYASRQYFATVKSDIGERAHIEAKSTNSTIAQNRDYCTKDGDFFEAGQVPPEKGSRSDLERIANAIRDGARVRTIAQQHGSAYIRYNRGIERLHFRLDQPRRWAPVVTVLYGDAGTGKSRHVWETEDPEFTGESLWVFGSQGGWFDGYDGHEAVLFDDFGGHEFKFTYLLKLMDRYPFQAPVKGGWTQWKPQRIYFTSNKRHTEWYQDLTSWQLQALLRRVTKVLLFKHNQEPELELDLTA